MSIFLVKIQVRGQKNVFQDTKNWLYTFLVICQCVSPIRVKNRDRFQQLLKEKGIDTIIHYPIPVHLQESYRECRDQSSYLPITEKLAEEIVSLPLYPELTEPEIDYIIKTVTEIY